MKLNPSLLSVLAVLPSTLARKNVVGGDPTDVNEYPFIVSISNGMYRCGGSIIDPNHILTAALCVIDFIDHPERLKIRAGSSQYASGGTIVNVTRATVHPGFTFGVADIAVLRLEEDLEFDEDIAPIYLPSASSATIQTGSDCEVIGWGVTNTTINSLSPTLNVATVKVVDHEQCVREYADSHHIDENNICASIQGGGKDACQGDGGGPLVETTTGRQVGIVSWGIGCALPNRSGVYTSVRPYVPWILDATYS
ncbi:hypothetical protein BDV06DRAFT_183242 [Aspergillus oleicola]